jgi:hypothetical protein
MARWRHGWLESRSINDALQWFGNEDNVAPLAGGTQMRASLLRIAEARREDEPSTLKWFLDHAGLLGDRLRIVEGTTINESTVATYVSRARSAIRAFHDNERKVLFNQMLGSALAGMPSEPTIRGSALAAQGGSGASEYIWGQYPPDSPGSVVAIQTKPKPLDLEGEISEALAAVARWPRLRPFLLAPLFAAIEELEKLKKAEDDL